MNPSIHRERSATRANKELPEGPNLLWLAVTVLLNIIIFAGFGYLLWDFG